MSKDKRVKNLKERIANKRKLKMARKIKSKSYKSLFLLSLSSNVYFIDQTYNLKILTNIYEIYEKVIPMVEALI